MPPGPQHDRRTGVAFLSLVAATNVIPWMELLLGQTAAAEPVAPSEVRIAVAKRSRAESRLAWCAYLGGDKRAAAAKFAALAKSGADSPEGDEASFMAARSLDIPLELPIFAGVWYLVILPIGLVAGFSLGRAGRIPGRPREGDS